MENTAPSKNSAVRYTVFLAFLAFVLYANTLGHQYAFDDSIVITDNSFTKQGFRQRSLMGSYSMD